MRDGYTEKYRRTLDLQVTDDGVIDAGTLLTFMREHVEEHLSDQQYPHLFYLGSDEVPPTARVSFGPTHLTLTWTERDVSDFNDAIDQARDAKERAKDDNAQVTVTDGAADTV